MRILGLDLGTKTLGLAVSDLTETISSGLTTLRFNENEEENVIPELKKIVEEYNVSLFVIGLPKNMNNTLGDAVLRTRNFEEILKRNFDIKIEEQDERLSSVTANNVLISSDISRKKRKNKVDKLAATIILQNYLDIHKERK
ncbi:MAG: Holliday junction resolvase RuvX [Tenericutes bacterium]|nr:Holliday junction resolvase RuvX [Mycoplasmatota bacterium]